jgi:hypothetical protein
MLWLAQAALLAFVALMGVDRPSLPLPGHAQWSDLAALLATAALLASRPRRLVPGALAGAAIAYAGWAALSSLIHGAGGWKALGVAELACVMMVTSALASDPAMRDRVLRVWLAAATAWSAVALVGVALAIAQVPSVLYDPRGGDLNLPWRARGLFVTSNLLASYLVVPLVLLVTDGKRWLGRWRAPALVLVGAAFAATLSRTWLAAALAALWLTTRGWKRTAGVTLLLLATLASVRLDLYRDAAGHVTVSTAPGVRWRLAEAALGSALAHPLVGVGPDAWPARIDWPRPGDPPTELSAHSTPLDVAARLGFPALLAFLLVCALALRDGSRATDDDPTRAVLYACLCALFFDALTTDAENFRHLWLLFGLAASSPLPDGKR